MTSLVISKTSGQVVVYLGETLRGQVVVEIMSTLGKVGITFVNGYRYPQPLFGYALRGI